MNDKKVIVLVAGGTGGHLFPAEALAVELRWRGYDVHLITDERARSFVRSFDKEHTHIVSSATFTRCHPFALIKTFWSLLRGMGQSLGLFYKLRPVLVGGFGGYPSFPPLFIAALMRRVTFIHEQNAVMGRANRVLAIFVRAIAGGLLSPHGPYPHKTLLTGNPVREAVLKAAEISYQPSIGDEPFYFLIFGGSQGASFFSHIVPEAIALLDDQNRKRLKIVQQIRGDAEELIKTYCDMGIQAEVAPFFDDMAERMAHAHFILSRAGASSVCEIAVIGRPALLVPYPHALDHDQSANAALLARVGGAQIILEKDLNAQKLSALLMQACCAPHLLEKQALAAKKVGQPHATRCLADMAESLIAGRLLSDIKEELFDENAT
ncbi:UDP-N-acetylglucosamine--N-acetylmuramyl-(pentapeptide) pyrophosphoryl-undecaprenol N-acetylglucosamine transferase [Bartonella krasnovii]|uniref:UDP-N-acetylglucosamine--N-acetylmuramyl- (pentapeptide) pyrophosphoryl-undecaprenol N-acetylglucosamine transferase n=1 Tax=Bartonella krasnovii TaxID=2267275 RepID=UPI001F4C8E43|nr:UDP-N-acetylglucosamine--N-acetylmuramyl-(pentapeptide) pyrophosphoryl-undecaprenol N-acetylglucosamine transferase [Bartonella krasnovii]UNF38213.1 UDP-N-acetylglucosamine--N-acetylmuramyl-(pentapeptide) pyrophosphoryl-undecaprenol N-acetylglucosamine transferase [Bartonella krasnovii]UNF46501.1 UDP-N-acetylglucosamine--N-acetylmuramyl-(pentapeptide) pyrophosphoryl-undecaprenol N-acetylglucosamine transferase [Bartonella krasnovii]UNF49752.1 UDP-N-acetylglucosamine--N-acetylmuramyl-(pentapep